MNDCIIVELGEHKSALWAATPTQKVLLSYAAMGKAAAEQDLRGERHTLYELLVPPTVYGLTHYNGNYKVAQGFITLEDPSQLWALPLPNGSGGGFCNYAYGADAIKAITGFWHSGFNQNAGGWQQKFLTKWDTLTEQGDWEGILTHLKSQNHAQPAKGRLGEIAIPWKQFLVDHPR